MVDWRCWLGLHYREPVEYPIFKEPDFMCTKIAKRCKRCRWHKTVMYKL